MKIVCLDASTLGSDVSLDVFAKFGEFVSYHKTDKIETIERLKGADVVITNKVIIDRDVMDATNLKLICISATGMNNVDLDYAKAKNIAVKNVAGYSTNSVAQHTFACLLALVNRIKFYDDYVQSGEWVKSEIFTNLDRSIGEISGKNFGIIGLGEIGRSVARIAMAFGANVSYYSTSVANDNAEFKRQNLDELLKSCNIVSIHAPLNEKTRNLISSKELNLMKEGAVLMNFGRGGIVDESALAKAIDERNLKACIDVLESEPMRQNHPLLSIKNKENLIITPHVAWASKEAREKLINLIVKNIEDFIKES
ncbi:D-2-hydroxyacid dehydrogenase [Campylobacter sp. CCUG 57310]|uniref:D-2-hydroxyacid dehydrogenase n=1 Tax=Campylobacter sp. CCUG 57310 TaxID=2517362 RepID=UPI0015645E91|nr:D-2-hydroxyacid dehydrogenase [Campylobacter sp. CCUG 57310]QKF92997.1 2-hydroxyacid dehydrogenase [Campylobacter sp. CCUG 57310]